MAETIEKDGEEITVYTQQEVDTAKEAAIKEAIGAKEARIAELERLNAERAENFTAYSKMTEEEKKAYDANTVNLLKRDEVREKELTELKETLAQKEAIERKSSVERVLGALHQGSEEAKQKLEGAYAALAGMPETTPQEIQARAAAAARVAGIAPDPSNPLYGSFSGEAPTPKTPNNYTDTTEGKQALDMARAALGLKTE